MGCARIRKNNRLKDQKENDDKYRNRIMKVRILIDENEKENIKLT